MLLSNIGLDGYRVRTELMQTEFKVHKFQVSIDVDNDNGLSAVCLQVKVSTVRI
ncbi:hypothetical protein D3C71_2140650 [compost metagenome]